MSKHVTGRIPISIIVIGTPVYNLIHSDMRIIKRMMMPVFIFDQLIKFTYEMQILQRAVMCGATQQSQPFYFNLKVYKYND